MILLKPCEGRYTDGFGPRGYVPGVGDLGFHYAQDIAAPEGTPIVSAADGVISNIWFDTFSNGVPAGGHMVSVNHGSFETRYAHLSNYANISVGDSVGVGQRIGYVGSSGAANGPHLDFALLVGGYFYDPLPYIVDKIEVAKKEEFKIRRNEMTTMFISCVHSPVGTPSEPKFAVVSLGVKGGWTEFTGQSSADRLSTQLGLSMPVSAGYFNELKRQHKA